MNLKVIVIVQQEFELTIISPALKPILLENSPNIKLLLLKTI